MKTKIDNAYKRGLVDVGKYGGNVDSGVTIGINQPIATTMANIYTAIDDRKSYGYDCYSFGSGNNDTDERLFRALKMGGFKSIRCGAPGGLQTVKTKSPNGIYMVGTYRNYYAFTGSVAGFFAHGIATNPAAETNPALFVSYTDFLSCVSYALSESQKGGLLLLNMRQYAEMRGVS